MATGASNADLADHACRCAQGPADADLSSCDDRLAARHQACGAGGQQDRSGRFSTRCVRRHRRGLPAFAGPLGFKPIVADSDVGAPRRQYLGAERPARPGTRARRCSLSRRGRCRRATAPHSRSACRSNGSTGRISISAASAGTIAGGTIRPATRSSSLRPAALRASTRIVTMDGDLDRAEAGDAVTLTLTDEVDIARGDILATPTDAARSRRPIRRPSHLDERRSGSARPLLSA